MTQNLVGHVTESVGLTSGMSEARGCRFPESLLHSQTGFLWQHQTYIILAKQRGSKKGLSPNSSGQSQGFNLTVLV